MKPKRSSYLLFLIALLAILWPTQAVLAQDSAPTALVLTLEGPLTPAMAEYLSRGIKSAEQRGAELLILQLDTPGGSIDLMNSMVQTMRASRVPVIVYVAPRGAIAGSAGTVITLAGQVAAMAPQTAIGAASPVDMQGGDIEETLETKTKEIIKATLRSLAEARPAEAIALAEETVDSAKAVSASEALAIGLIDLIANDLDDLLSQLDGVTVETVVGEWTLDTTSMQLESLAPNFIEQLLGILTNPNIVFILLSVGVQAVLIELGHPGGWVPGFVGVACLALAGYGLGVLPVNWFGLIFVVTAFVLFVLEIKAPTKGALTAAGVASFVIGSLVLFNSPGTPSFFHVSVPLVVGVALLTAAVFVAVVSFAVRSLKTPIRTGQEALIGRTGILRSELKPYRSGEVHVGGELWTAELAEGEKTLLPGTRVEVIAVEGVRLKVRGKGD